MTPSEIKRIRKSLNLTQEELGALIGAYQETVARWEAGTNEPKGAYLKALEGLKAKAKTKRRSAK